MTRKTRKPEGGRGPTKHTNPAERDASEDTKVGGEFLTRRRESRGAGRKRDAKGAKCCSAAGFLLRGPWRSLRQKIRRVVGFTTKASRRAGREREGCTESRRAGFRAGRSKGGSDFVVKVGGTEFMPTEHAEKHGRTEGVNRLIPRGCALRSFSEVGRIGVFNH